MSNLIISHGDGDGICACAICYRALKKDAIILFAQPFNIELVFKKLSDNNELHSFDNFYIVDVGYNNNIKKYLDELKNNKKKITYIDHHPQSLVIKKIYKGIINTDYSSSTLTAHYFHILTPLEKIGSACDKTILLSKIDPLYKEAEILRKALIYDVNDDIFRLKVVKELADGKLPSEIDEVLEREGKSDDKNNTLYNLAINNIKYEDEKIIIIDLKPIELFGMAGNIASRIAIENMKAVFLIYGNNRTIITARCHRGMDINIGLIMQKYYNGGGHKYAGSGTASVDIEVEKLIDDIKKIIWSEK